MASQTLIQLISNYLYDGSFQFQKFLFLKLEILVWISANFFEKCSQPAIPSLKLTIETVEQSVNYVQS